MRPRRKCLGYVVGDILTKLERHRFNEAEA